MLEVRLQQFAGMSKGLHRVLPLDHVIVIKPDGTRVGVGFLDHKPNAVLRFTRYLDKDLREMIRREAARMRQINGLPEIALITVGPPNPKLIKAWLNGDIKPKKTSVIVPGAVGGGDADSRSVD